MNEYRVTKYNPALRDSTGAFTGNEWTSVTHVGRSFAGVKLTREEYDRVEHAYVGAALAFLHEGGLNSLRVEGLENTQGQHLAFGEGTVLSLAQVGETIGRVLREEFWCRLQGIEGFIHIGWDYYMYIGVPNLCPVARAQAVMLGLYVEEFDSPYKEAG